MPYPSLEFASFVVVLLIIAAAFDLWLIRAWKRYRRRHPRAEEKKDNVAAIPFSGGSVSGAKSLPDSGKATVTVEPPAPPSKRRGKTVAQKASLSVQGRSGRTTHVEISMDLPEGESIRLTLESVGPESALPPAGKAGAEIVQGRRPAPGVTAAIPGTVQPVRPNPWLERGRLLLSSFWNDVQTSGRSLFCLALIIYLLVRLIGLQRWPIFFFSDEAIQTNLAAELVKGNFVWNKEFLPTFFSNGGQDELNFSVYVQVIPYLMFGKSVFVTRAVSVLVTLLGAAALGLILRRVFRLPLWWSGVLIFSVIPVWFLHSRTAFELVESISFYILFIYFYMRYRTDEPWWLLPALCFGALSAYIYSPAQVTVAVTGALLLVSDLPYHWRNKRIALVGLATLAVLALPYVRFLIRHPTGNKEHLAIIGSYLVNPIPLAEKIRLFFTEYLRGLDPRYWYLANPPEGVYHDIVRHVMKGYGFLSLGSLPFTLLGILLCLGNIRSSKFRTVLILLLAAPVGGAIAKITITRTMFMVVPSALLTSLGVSWLVGLFERRDGPELPDYLAVWRERAGGLLTASAGLRATIAERPNIPDVRAFVRRWKERTARSAALHPGLARISYPALALSLFLVLASVNGYMLWDSLTSGPTWYQNYTLYGMQYGGQQLSSALMAYNQAHPDSNLIVTSSWANGTDEIFSFFLPQQFPLRVGTIQDYTQNYIPIQDTDVFVMTADEYLEAQGSGRFAEIRILETIPYPNGAPGFYFAHPRYVDNIQEIIAAEQAELAKPVEENLNLGGEIVRTVHSRLDMGKLQDAFDENPYSVIRSLQDNPLYLDMFFPTTHSFTSVRLHIGGGPTRMVVTIYPSDGNDPKTFSAEAQRATDYRDLEIRLPAPIESSHIRLDVWLVGESPPTHVHVYEIDLEGVGWQNGTAAPSP